jgi:hypothetical protein
VYVYLALAETLSEELEEQLGNIYVLWCV